MDNNTKPPIVPWQPWRATPPAPGQPLPKSWRGFRKLWRKIARKPRGSFARPDRQVLTIEVEDESLRAWPTVHITAEAHGKMRALIEACPIEVSWLATCVRDGEDVDIDDIFVPGQDCTSGSTVVTGEGDLLTTLMAERLYDSIKRLNCWGHSHVTGAVFASGLDEFHTQGFITRAKDMRKDFFVRLIANKWDDLFASLYLFDQGLAFHDVPLRVDPPETDKWRAWARREVRSKVRKIHMVPVKRVVVQPQPQSIIIVNGAAAGPSDPPPLVDVTGKKEGET